MRLTMAGLAFCVLAVPAFAAPPKAPKQLKVRLITTSGQSAGDAIFEQKGDVLKVTVHARNLEPGDHGVHIHEHPMCDLPDFKTAGGHFNPDGKQHGFENPNGHHAGDTPKNLHVIGAGHTDREIDFQATQIYHLTDVSMGTGKPNDILANGGTSLIIHAGADDMKTDPSGNSGGRMACGVISLTAPPTPKAVPVQPAPDK